MTRVALVLAVLAAGVSLSEESTAKVVVTVDPDVTLGSIRPMNAVNGGPAVKKPNGRLSNVNFEDYAALRVPYARTHDCVACVPGGAHACDISAIFPDFEADETDPQNYDFVFTDHYLDNMRRAGTEVFFRLGQTIEQGPKKYGVLPPKDFAKWARICEHVIRHYNEGWAWGADQAYTTINVAWSNQFNVVYWEIWNEPDLDRTDGELPKNPRNWGGTATNFFEFYEIAAKHLKAKFPKAKIGGPAIAGNEPWAARFLAWCRERKVPLDFFSWHAYASGPGAIVSKGGRIRKLLDDNGFETTESILDEWNYVKGWTDDWVYSRRVESTDLNLKGAAFTAATMASCQSAPIDMLMYYDVRPRGMNGLFQPIILWPMKGYYPFYAWSKLVDYGTQVGCTVADEKAQSKPSAKQFFVVAAKGAGGTGAVFVTRYPGDDNTSDIGTVTVRVSGRTLARARCHLTDLVRTYTEVPLLANADGSAAIRLQPLSFALIEW